MTSAHLKKFNSVRTADIEWRNELPYSKEFDDVYFSIHGAVDESQHVFIEGNHLPDDWIKTKQSNQFYLAELGFGSGLNFLNTASNWLCNKHQLSRSLDTPMQLNYVAIEKRPFRKNDLEQTFNLWPQFSSISKILLANYPSQSYGRHQINFKTLNITLTLMFMPVEKALNDLVKESNLQENKLKFDHWYLDGFAPTKNADMWNETNADMIARLSKEGTRLASYSVAASVRRPLEAAGFHITKRKGFAKKREMLTARFTGNTQHSPSPSINIKYETPWFNVRHSSIEYSGSQSSSFSRQNKIAVIGAGIAGCMTALALSNRGIDCDILDSHSSIADGASGAAAGIYHPQITADMNLASQFSWLAFEAFTAFLSQLSAKERKYIGLISGVKRFLENKKTFDSIMNLADSSGMANCIKPATEINSKNVIDYQNAGALNIQRLCKLIINNLLSPRTALKLNSHVSDLTQASSEWKLNINGKTHHYDHVIYCGGAKSNLLASLGIENIHYSRGQTCYFSMPELSKSIDSPWCEKLYLVPTQDYRNQGEFHLGSTFDNFDDNNLNPRSQTELFNNLKAFLNRHEIPFAGNEDLMQLPLQGNVGYRLHASDRLPLVGALYDEGKLHQDFSNLGQKRLIRADVSQYNFPGIWINSGYGSHGLLYSSIASEHLVSLITNSISPIDVELSNAINPARFLIRSLKH